MHSYDDERNKYHKLSEHLQRSGRLDWARNVTQMRFIGAPFLALFLIFTYKTVFPPTIINVNVQAELEIKEVSKPSSTPNMSIAYLGLFKKFPHYIGLIILFGIFKKLITSLLDAYSINLMEPFYIQNFLLFSIIVLFSFTIYNLFKYLTHFYFYKNQNAIISNKLPKFLFNYLNDTKLISIAIVGLKKAFLLNFFISFFLLILYCLAYFYL